MPRPPTSPTKSSAACGPRSKSGARSPTSNAEQASPLRYLALGDSYTIGTGASESSRAWPSIVAARLQEQTQRKVELTNPAVNGFTTLDLIEHELPHLSRIKPDLVTILIGVNDLVQGRTPDQYRASLKEIYTLVAGPHVAAVSIPDWSFVPAASEFGGQDLVGRLTEVFNKIARKEASERGFEWIDITEASRSGIGSLGWIASDELHPGDAQYAAWAEVIWDRLRR
jgi:lysophospholipase L1-like esterase